MVTPSKDQAQEKAILGLEIFFACNNIIGEADEKSHRLSS